MLKIQNKPATMFKLIAIIDRSHIIREGITAVLRRGNICQRIGSLESPDEWLPAFKDTEPDLIIISPELWHKTGGIGKLKTKEPAGKPPVVGIICHYCDRETLGLFDETIYITDSDEVIIGKLRRLQKQDSAAKTQNLTAREKDVLRLLLQGYSNKEVADRLAISAHTVIAHRKNIVEKTGIRSLPGLAVYALLNNISDMDQISK